MLLIHTSRQTSQIVAWFSLILKKQLIVYRNKLFQMTLNYHLFIWEMAWCWVVESTSLVEIIQFMCVVSFNLRFPRVCFKQFDFLQWIFSFNPIKIVKPNLLHAVVFYIFRCTCFSIFFLFSFHFVIHWGVTIFFGWWQTADDSVGCIVSYHISIDSITVR